MSDEREKDWIARAARAFDPDAQQTERARLHQIRVLLCGLLVVGVLTIYVLVSVWNSAAFFPILAVIAFFGSVIAGVFLLRFYITRKIAGLTPHWRLLGRGAAITVCILVYVTFTPARCAIPLVSQAMCEVEDTVSIGER